DRPEPLVSRGNPFPLVEGIASRQVYAVARKQVEANQVSASFGDDGATVELGRELIASINRRPTGDRERPEPAISTQLRSAQCDPRVDTDRKNLVGICSKI